MFRTSRTFILFLILIIGLLTSAKAKALDIDNVRFGVHSNKIRMVLDLSEPAEFRAFILENPSRMVIDLPDFFWQAGKVARPPEAGITDIRQGPLQPGVSRIVFDLRTPTTISQAFLLPRQEGKPPRIVVDFAKSTSGNIAAHTRIHGNLQLGANTAATIEPASAAEARYPSPPQQPPMPERKPSETMPAPTLVKKPLIIIDPGHGGVDPGASGPQKLREKNVVLALAQELKKQLLETGRYRVMMTRENDTFIMLKNRVAFARKNGGDLFVSIHADSIGKSDVSGVSVYTLSREASDAQTAKLAETENKVDMLAGIDLSAEDAQVANILYDFAITDTMNQSKFLANTIVEKLKDSGVKTLPRPHRFAGFAVLKAPDIPSILVEAGFMSNSKESAMLNKPDYRKKIAAALHRGIDAYFHHVQANERS